MEKCGIAFMFAPIFHPAFKKVAGVRKSLGANIIIINDNINNNDIQHYDDNDLR